MSDPAVTNPDKYKVVFGSVGCRAPSDRGRRDIAD